MDAFDLAVESPVSCHRALPSSPGVSPGMATPLQRGGEEADSPYATPSASLPRGPAEGEEASPQPQEQRTAGEEDISRSSCRAVPAEEPLDLTSVQPGRVVEALEQRLEGSGQGQPDVGLPRAVLDVLVESPEDPSGMLSRTSTEIGPLPWDFCRVKRTNT